MKITKSTEENYRIIAERLLKKCKRIKLSRNLKWETVAQWMIKNVWPEVRHNTWRLYRSAVIYYVELNNPEERDIVSSMLDTGRHPSNKAHPARTSSGKQKHIYGNEFKQLSEHLMSHKKKWNLGALVWLQATIHTGLRPCEWDTATFIDGNKIESARLVVNNAKNTHDRAHGETRTIYLDHLEPKEIRIVNENLNAIKKIVRAEGYDKYYRKCAEAIREAGRKIWPLRKKRPTLYSARHQFSANCKARGLKKKEIAALMGHATDDTATAHYGKKSSGTKGKAPRANETEVGRVKEVSNNPMSIKENKDSKDKGTS